MASHVTCMPGIGFPCWSVTFPLTSNDAYGEPYSSATIPGLHATELPKPMRQRSHAEIRTIRSFMSLSLICPDIRCIKGRIRCMGIRKKCPAHENRTLSIHSLVRIICSEHIHVLLQRPFVLLPWQGSLSQLLSQHLLRRIRQDGLWHRFHQLPDIRDGLSQDLL